MSDPADPGADVEQWRAELEAKRDEKDRFFAEHPQSPIPPDDREAFDGLGYFEPDPAYRVQAMVTAHDEPAVVLMETTSGREMRYLRVATLEFELAREEEGLTDGSYELAAYQLESPNDEPLFVPFRDKTTGQQSYRGGRYMELSPERELADSDEIVLDFNLAYTPFCAYSDTFDCPLPPEENWLEVAVPVGERID